MWLGVAPTTNSKKEVCLKVFEIHAHNMIIIIGSIVNIFTQKGVFTLAMNRYSYELQKTMRKVAMASTCLR